MEQAKKEGEEKEKERREADREEEIKLELLDASLKQVMRYGWSKDAVRAAAEELGRPSVVAGLVKGGGAELVLHHVAVCNQQLNMWMEKEVARQREAGVAPRGSLQPATEHVDGKRGGKAEGSWWQDQSGKVCQRGCGAKIEHEWRVCEGRPVGRGSCTNSSPSPL